MDIALTPPQKEFVFCGDPHPAMVAGLGSGKTHAATIRFIIQMLQEPGINTLLGMPTYDLLKLRALPGFEEALNKIGLPYTTNKSDYSIEIKNYGFIYFRSYDRPERWVSFEVAHTLLDELDTLPRDKAKIVWRKANERTRQNCKSGNTIGAVTTPDQGVNGFVYEKWVKQKQEGYTLIKASTLSNPYLPDSYVDQIKNNYDPILADLYINGEFVSLSQNKVYHFFDRKTHHTDRKIEKSDEILHIGIDFNVGGTCANTWLIEGNIPIAVDEFVSHDTYDLINNIKFRYKGKKIICYPDASGNNESTNATRTNIALLMDAGFHVDCPKQNPAVRDRINAYNALLSHGQIAINTDKCPELTFALESQGYDKKGKPEKFDDHPSIDDWTDSSGYFINRKFPIIRPVTNIKAGFMI